MRRFIAARQKKAVPQWDWRAAPRGEDLRKEKQTLEKSAQNLRTILK